VTHVPDARNRPAGLQVFRAVQPADIRQPSGLAITRERKDVYEMHGSVDWNEVLTIMGAGFGWVFAIMVILAVVTTVVGKIVQKFEKSKEEKQQAS
jgi:hypothetical protein